METPLVYKIGNNVVVEYCLPTVCLACQRELPAGGPGIVSPMSIHLMTHLYLVIYDNDASTNTRAPLL
jgi:hypothetical protein